ncbi:hypothetical protein [Aquibium oceanicum]|uniref:Uncharacterized protein n=1 Tax=Aquibium oceanicum TaxID=1670800 RepID=A0A1L3SXL5_9HYPH|nr:hypothetical protein [Aquibium oceanicum]APH74173.1 hypothetical protein BSQ44_24475 [Aquibium oceanicum]
MLGRLRLSALIFAASAAAFAPSATAQETDYAMVKGWRIFSEQGGLSGGLVCYMSKDNGRVELRLGTDGGDWLLGMPYYDQEDRTGAWGFDGLEAEATFQVIGSGWAYMSVSREMLRNLRNEASVSLELDRGVQSFSLSGSAAAMTKVEECVDNRGRPAGGNRSVQTRQPASPAPRDNSGSQGAKGATSQVGRWQLQRFRDHCAVTNIQGQEKALRFAFDGNVFEFGFMGIGSHSVDNSIPVEIWFDGSRSGSETLEGALTTDAEGVEWRSFADPANEPGHEDGFMNASSFHAAYTTAGGDATETFSLKGSSAALRSLFDCGHKVSGSTMKAAPPPATSRMATRVTPQTAPVEDDAYRLGRGCPKLGAVVSDDSAEPASVEFRYAVGSGNATLIYWLDLGGNPVEMSTFDATDAIVRLDSFVGHSFIVKDFQGTCYGGFFEVQPGRNVFVVR